MLQHFHLSHYNNLYIKYYSSLIIYDDQLLVFYETPTTGRASTSLVATDMTLWRASTADMLANCLDLQKEHH